ncbi:TRAP transporter small permease subunit [Alisedimentitalea sp. MJ-SS2]|uniref:TRAP transporter small permease subunit n=1 Tax=Aliisedimentitalea sp. MJ-SS2 TaxID=3049795 RepID=UPI00291470D0|nr:TRAP transporter small permease subunit [Alisedimentitalea sp. MJ-SS2]MDU8927654.1 TRAP transporter small permease subunit [Alisedimentitalea sp. MJ-SS2]
MSATATNLGIEREGLPARLSRIVGWTMLGLLTAFLINNVLVVGYGFGGLRAGTAGGMGFWVPVAIYGAMIAAAVLYVLSTPTQALRWDAMRIHDFNVFFIRFLFWAVLLVGIADCTVALMRVEKILLDTIGDDGMRNLGKASWVATRIHFPLIGVAFVVALFTRTLGFLWLALLIVAAELMIVISRFVFSYEQALMGDLVRYWYAALFLFASAYTLFEDGHVRVDVLYAGFGTSKRGFVNAFGAIAFGMSTCWVIIILGFNGKQSMINSPVMNFEVSQQGSVGMFVKYQMALFLGLFAITMLIQFVSYFFEAVADRRGEPGHREAAASAAH